MKLFVFSAGLMMTALKRRRFVPRKFRCVRLLALWFGLIPLLTSCVAEFINPIPPPKSSEPDPALLGEWEMTEKDEKVKLYIYPRRSGWIDIISVEIDSKNKIKLDIYEGYTTQIKQGKFLCLKEREMIIKKEETEESGYYIVPYKISDDGRFSFRIFDVDRINDMIRKGELKGNITRWKTIVTSGADELVSLILKKGVDSFIEPKQDQGFTFSRPKK